MARRVDPKTVDYDKDGTPGSLSDIELSKQDANQDGRISPQEQRAYKRKQSKPQVAVTTNVFDSQGRVVKSVTKTPLQQEEKPKPKTAADFGVSKTFLEKYPDMVPFLLDAINKNYDEAKFNFELENTQFGKDRTNAQAAYDIAIEGPNAEDLRKRVQDRASQLRQEFMAAGIQVSDQQLQQYAQEIVRSDLSNQDVLGMIASQFSMPGATPGGRGLQGTSSQIYSELVKMARDYGLSMTDATLQQKVKQGLQQGAGWQSWLEGQRGLFREQAKMQYPTISDRLDRYTMAEMVDPYLNDAADILGLNKQNLDYLDPLWSKALMGPTGPMSRDQWVTTLKTDPRYGWDRTIKARQEYANLADNLLSVFGMA